MKAHVCIGGPLDGEFAATIDFYGRWVAEERRHEEGMYEHLKGAYVQFHNAHRGRAREARAHVVWIHLDLLPAPKALRDR